MQSAVSASMLWRLQDQSGMGAPEVSLVFKAQPLQMEHCLETQVVADESRCPSNDQEVLWQDEDQALFVSLAEQWYGVDEDAELHVDVQDPIFQQIIQVIAACRFGHMHSGDQLSEGFSRFTLLADTKPFSSVALYTPWGFIPAVVISIDSTHARLVLLRNLDHPFALLGRYDLVEAELSQLHPIELAELRLSDANQPDQKH